MEDECPYRAAVVHVRVDNLEINPGRLLLLLNGDDGVRLYKLHIMHRGMRQNKLNGRQQGRFYCD